MKFDFIVIRYRINTQDSKVLGGFLDLKSAQYFVERIEVDYLNLGFFYITSPDGKYIFGEKRGYREIDKKWYNPGEEAYVYSGEDDSVVHIDEVISIFSDF